MYWEYFKMAKYESQRLAINYSRSVDPNFQIPLHIQFSREPIVEEMLSTFFEEKVLKVHSDFKRNS
jgi:hypothetical protein